MRYAPLKSTASFTLSGVQAVIFKWKYDSDLVFRDYTAKVMLIGGTASYTNTLFQTCSVTASNLQVKLPDINSNQLNSIYATAGSTPFSIPLYCPSAVNLYMTITDNNNPGQSTSIISLNSASTASGVGIQIQRNGQPISMGPDSSAAYTTNQFFVGALSGSVNIPLSANYIRTGAISTGSVKAITTFTLSYQ